MFIRHLFEQPLKNVHANALVKYILANITKYNIYPDLAQPWHYLLAYFEHTVMIFLHCATIISTLLTAHRLQAAVEQANTFPTTTTSF